MNVTAGAFFVEVRSDNAGGDTKLDNKFGDVSMYLLCFCSKVQINGL